VVCCTELTRFTHGKGGILSLNQDSPYVNQTERFPTEKANSTLSTAEASVSVRHPPSRLDFVWF
ncbi:hypothetical protein, partial [Natronobacterium gregoryi]|uniref:hypothetical protein n=1 Tax=Natronobacterium gregoryi TaxID=44930 RepID=UPI001E5EA12B